MIATTALPRPFTGIIPPMVTPLREQDVLDVAGLERLIEHVLAGGVHGIFILGTTGEAPSLSYQLRTDLIRRVARQVANRVPVLVGITDTAIVESVRLADVAADAGAAGLVVAPPYYFPAGQPELIEYIQQLARAVALPLFLYNMPSHTKVVFECDTVGELADLPPVVGLKDSSANLVYFRKLQERLTDREDFTLLVGPEELLAEVVLLGGHGGVNGGANLFPRLYVELYNAAAAGDLVRTRQLHEQVMAVSKSVYAVGRHGSSMLKGLKCALAELAICSGFVAAPFSAFQPSERRRIHQNLIKLRHRWETQGHDFAVGLQVITDQPV